MKNNIDYKLYLVTDREMLKNRDIFSAVEMAIKGGVTLIQLREKDITTEEFYNIALKLKEITSRHNVSLIINDRLDIALAIDADGVHVGQQDMPAAVARKIIGKHKILGVSAATLEEAKKAEEDGADYVGIGAIFPTSTKDDARAVNINELIKIKKALNIPVVAIGGISEKNIELLTTAKIDGVAVISAILGKEDVKAASEDLRRQLDLII
ncbi:thiamine phosphate synthase [Clostridium omnivorum]|uniref:Thiamine-phosphate synthase n=1 Tax=Clostridium omnivorum TaxID=1604902 RepID=A0ABQ5N137_9CLOT|nr:thiamine phosphate synthase [Clostridium sp. E14]GLC28910.1 thiamine-phosphate synthase [Clostridium sp. E14]